MNDVVDPVAAAAPLVARLVHSFGARWVHADNVAAYAAEPGHHVLFFSGDPVRFPESLDVAVVLPELQRVFQHAFDIGVVTRQHEDTVARRYGERRWPALVFLRDGQYLKSLPGMHDWTDFVARVGEALAAPAQRVPGVGIPVVAGDAPAAPPCH